MPHVLISVFVVIFVVLIAAMIAASQKSRAADIWPFEKKRVLSESEQTVYWRLLKVAPDCVILAQVALSSLVDVQRKIRNRQAYRNKFSQKSVDFVLCRKDGSILVVIEVDDQTHLSVARSEADRAKNRIIEAAGIPILRWKAAPLPSEDAMRADIATVLTSESLRITVADKLSRG